MVLSEREIGIINDTNEPKNNSSNILNYFLEVWSLSLHKNHL